MNSDPSALSKKVGGGHLPSSRRRIVGVRMLVSLVTAVFATSLLFAACGTGNVDDDTTSTTVADESIAHPTGPNEIVLQITAGGGFVPVEYNLTLVPHFSLYGDGRVIVSGPVPAIYPGPALPNLQTTVVSEDAVQAILSAARDAGLFDPAFDYGRPTITDVATTSIVINADGTTYVSDIYALGMEAGASGLTQEQQQARAVVGDLQSRLMDLSTFTGEEIVWEPYEYPALAVYIQAVDPSLDGDPGDVEPNRIEWPLGDLSTGGEPVQPEGFRRLVISGEELDALRPLLTEATFITVWESGGSEYHLFFRPLLPEESE